MSSEGDQQGHYELKASSLSGPTVEGKIAGTVGIQETPDGWRVETFDDEGVRFLPRIWDTFAEADAFALGYIEGLDQGLMNAITVLDKVHAIDKSKIEILPQKVVRHGDDD
jgi:hypothetical protein